METDLLAAAAEAGGRSFAESIKPILIEGVQQLEGPYRWYVIMVVISILTAVITRFIFKTLKWFFILALLAGATWAVWELL